MNFSSLSGARVLEERERLGLSQASAGNICGVSREMWGKYERGRAAMGTEVLSKFAVAGADVLYVLTGERSSQAQPLTPREEALLDNYRHTSDAGQRIIEGAARAAAQPLDKEA